jgi:hypothetical protein
VTDWADDASDLSRQARAVQTIRDAAAKLNLSEQAFRTTLDQIATDPYTRFLVNVWS